MDPFPHGARARALATGLSLCESGMNAGGCSMPHIKRSNVEAIELSAFRGNSKIARLP